ncbi:hypothetical protein [Isoptericola dokdonensis]|jgi:hypothetical protein|uniref:DUF4232 domain-containing protein n=1 Tax=Isoptericola dokdonensis DS-3 TaxID=1300344 RepID=A0A161HY57_9MICO|nr:hypothetical protein [Isoptericola dokdonensis]ANC31303.1 hypothetical protein I598_1755 [Isoptericola dokdonensis DS-3]
MTAMVLLCTALLVGLGTTAGYGVAQGVQWVRDVWPDPVPELLADKAAPPEPLDLAGVARSCAPEVVGLDLTGGATRMTPGDPVDLTLTVTNLGRVPCLVDASPSNLQVTVTDADGERVWSSADCTGGSETPALLGQGETWEVSTRWSGSTSNAKCEGKPSEVGAGSYTLTPALGDVQGAQGEPLTLAVDAPAPEPKDDAKGADAKGTDAKGADAKGDGAKGDEKPADGEEGEAPPSGDESGEPDDGTPAAGDAVS